MPFAMAPTMFQRLADATCIHERGIAPCLDAHRHVYERRSATVTFPPVQTNFYVETLSNDCATLASRNRDTALTNTGRRRSY